MDIIEDLRGENNQAFGELYKEYFEMVNRFVIQNSGCKDDSEDIFQDTMIILLEKLQHDDFQLTASLKTYVMAIAKNLWLKKLKSFKLETPFTNLYDDQFNEEINDAIENQRSYIDILQHYIHKITKHCQGLIHDMFFKEKSIEEIQKKYKYNNKHTAQNQKHKCVEQIRKVKSLKK
ncbi:RNA polymerase sigma factor [Chryseobacterium terrae]|uniref:Sigma-70 family RNA polymerase sigma factor n=1 Tax=Chryseobacterium terrae TaxID=3163299 RepID=A0ABW8Y0D4_9FLAO